MREKRLRLLTSTAVLLVLGSVLFHTLRRPPVDVPILDIGATRIETAPLCPWREPESDLRTLFPGGTRYQTETPILSGLRLELAQRLGRMPTADENSIQLFRIYGQKERLGTVMTRRVKGEFGAIEIVLGVNTNGAVSGLRFQSLREPDVIATALTNASWLSAFPGKIAGSPCQLGQGLPDVPPEARHSAEAIAEGVRSLLVLLDTAEKNKPHVAHKHHSTNEQRRSSPAGK